MELRKPMTATEKRLFKEAVIREYQLKQEANQKKSIYLNNSIKKLKKAVPISILIGLIACILVVAAEGWKALLHIILYSIIWITLISTVLTALLKTK